MEKKSLNRFYPIRHKGFEYVDLGLPSGTLWAKCNIGAEREVDYGLLFQWGDTQGYTAEQVGRGIGLKCFGCEDYKWTNGLSLSMTKYNVTDGKTVLDLEDDAAHVNMGGDWIMPTNEQLEELITLRGTWKINYQGSGINGCLFSGANGNELFIPAVGYAYFDTISYRNHDLGMWSSSLNKMDILRASMLYISDNASPLGGNFIRVVTMTRIFGFGVRGVLNR